VVLAAAVPPETTRAQVKRWIEEERVAVDGRVVSKPAFKVRPGMQVVATPPPPAPLAAIAEDLPLTILHEDEDLVVIHKPAGVVVHPAAGHGSGTLVNALLGRYRTLPGEDPVRPGIVHRLDKDTSGVMVVTRSELARTALSRSFATHDIERVYLAIVIGAPPPRGTFETTYGRHPTDRKRWSSRAAGRRAVTHYRVLERLEGAVLVEARLETGRTHQVRVHFSDHGFGLLGDPLYGRAPRSARLRRVAEALGRQALHATVLGFVHPRTGGTLRFEVAPPEDFQVALAALRDRGAA